MTKTYLPEVEVKKKIPLEVMTKTKTYLQVRNTIPVAFVYRIWERPRIQSVGPGFSHKWIDPNTA